MQIDFIDSPETIKAREPFLLILQDMEKQMRLEIERYSVATVQRPSDLVAIHRRHLMKTQPVIAELVRIEQRSVRHIMVAS